MSPQSLSIKEARKLVLNSQRVLESEKSGRAEQATLNAIKHLGYIQIDTISVIERAHHHTLWSRNPRYKAEQLNSLHHQGKIFEYWSHAAAYLPIQDFRYSLPYKAKVTKGDELWFKSDAKIKRKVLQRIQNEGPLQSRDFENHGQKNLAMWEWKPAKYALESLFMEGKLMVQRRDNFQKVYDLTERVLPGEIDTSMPSEDEFSRYLITRFLQSHGLGLPAEMAYLRRGEKANIAKVLEQMLENGEVIEVSVKKQNYFAFPDVELLLKQPLSKSRLKILSPFDNFVIQRKRLLNLFDYDYQIECYVPQKKRKHGYFCLPILWNADLVGRMDCKADRKSGDFIIKRLQLESDLNTNKPYLLKNIDKFSKALIKQLKLFMQFHNSAQLRLENIENQQLKKNLKQFVKSNNLDV